MDIVHPEIDAYLGDLAALRDPVLDEMEALAERRSFPIVGPQVGRLLHLLTRVAGAQRVLELGSGFGYSAFWFARAVGPGGSVVLTDMDAGKLIQAREFLGRAGLGDRVTSMEGDALASAHAVRAGGGTVEVVFNDVDKQDYPRVADLAAGLLVPGGLLISDNVLWKGRVTRPAVDDAETRAVKEMNRRLRQDERFETVWLPVRDGVSVSRRVGQ